MLARQCRNRRHLVLDRAELLERILRLDRQQLVQDARRGIDRQPLRGEVHLLGRRDDVRLLADVQDHRLAVETDNRLKQG